MSDKPLSKRLILKENMRFVLLNAPEDYPTLLGELPIGVKISSLVGEPADVIQAFVSSQAELLDLFEKIRPTMQPKTSLWITYPKGTSKKKTDINRDIIWKLAELFHLKPAAMIAVDEIWAALRLMPV